MKIKLEITLEKIDGGTGPRPELDIVHEILNDEIVGLELWEDDYGYAVTEMVVL